MFAQRQRPIDFATEGLLLAHRVGRNCAIPDEIEGAKNSNGARRCRLRFFAKIEGSLEGKPDDYVPLS
jgi:hypothetical protein